MEDIDRRTDTNRDFRKSDVDNEIYGMHRHKKRGGRQWEKAINSQRRLSRGKYRNQRKQSSVKGRT